MSINDDIELRSLTPVTFFSDLVDLSVLPCSREVASTGRAGVSRIVTRVSAAGEVTTAALISGVDHGIVYSRTAQITANRCSE